MTIEVKDLGKKIDKGFELAYQKLEDQQKQIDDLAKRTGFKMFGASGGTDVQSEADKDLAEFAKKGGTGEIQVKEMSTLVGSEGGYGVTPDQDPNILNSIPHAQDVIDGVEVKRIDGKEYQKIIAVTNAGVGNVSEKGARPETASPTYEMPTIVATETYANPRMTQMLLDTSSPHDMANHLKTEIATAIREFHAQEVVTGDGVAPNSLGILTAADSYDADGARAFSSYQLVKSGTDGDFDLDDLIDLAASLDARYKGPDAAFYASTSAITKMRKLKDADGNYLWQDASGVTGAAQTLMGYKVVESQFMPAVGVGSKSVMFGDLKKGYTFVQNKSGYRILRDPYSEKGWVSYYTTITTGSGPMDTRAVRVLELAA